MMEQQGKVLLITVFFLFFTANNIFAQTNKPNDSIKVEYLYPANKEKVFTETVDQFYGALRNRSYPVHQEFYRKHIEFTKNIRIHMET
ncbi:hypothetical protein [Neobacillus ginsengisoli]|uniref:Uncharacterized protein n=1 Tax=Neobacillus ginsengisoli TaxID=904295 RepID=A0ABT9XSD2_9BACI|nr:hypothetical protein [Neobacillus ginsengisoli]MDQ0198271.1 hypothetical protein [Neobacillus ginsengisoli]